MERNAKRQLLIALEECQHSYRVPASGDEKPQKRESIDPASDFGLRGRRAVAPQTRPYVVPMVTAAKSLQASRSVQHTVGD